MADFSVIIPTYKRRDSLFNLLEALASQKQVILEIIVIDQNPMAFFSEDELQILHQAIHIIQGSPNVSAARNRGAELASSDLIIFVDDDLVPDDGFCHELLLICQNYPVVKAFSPLVFSYEDKSRLKAKFFKRYIKSTDDITGVHLIEETISACLIFDKQYFYDTGGFDPVLFSYAGSTEDQELFKRMKARGMKFWHVPGIEIFHDDKTPGGCDLRSEEYWQSRYKFMKGWVYRYMMHNIPAGKLSRKSYFHLIKSAFLNWDGMRNGISYSYKQFALLNKAIFETKLFFDNIQPYGVNNNVHTIQFVPANSKLLSNQNIL